MKKNCCDDDDFIAKTNDVTTDKVITNNLRSPQKDRLTNRKSIHEINEVSKF